jgi:RNA polymerase sigma-70 factor, ECF subfamily
MSVDHVWLRAYKALGRFQSGRRFSPWVCTIAANAARDLLRDPIRRVLRFGLTRRPEQSAAAEPSLAPLEEEQRRDALARDLSGLSLKLREAVVLRYVSALSVEEVAEALGIGVSAAKMRIKRGLEQLEALGR